MSSSRGHIGRYAPYTVVLSDHAKDRCKEYLGSTRGVRAQISAALMAALRIGVEPDREPGKELCVEVRWRCGFRAECYPVDAGYWIVATVIPPDGWASMEVAATGKADSESSVLNEEGESINE